MTHTGPLPDSAGTFSKPQVEVGLECPQCQDEPVTCEVWESNDGAYEDHRYTCTRCGHQWWVDGIDA